MFLWKENFRTGVDLIDNQHMDLFAYINNLLMSIVECSDKEHLKICILRITEAIKSHFVSEEAYQKLINYPNYEELKKFDDNFIQTLMQFKFKFIQSDYSLSTIKEFAGTSTAWLIYHVLDNDLQIIKIKTNIDESSAPSYISSFSKSFLGVLQMMLGFDTSDAKQTSLTNGSVLGDIYVTIGIVGDIEGKAVFGFSKKFAFHLIEMITFTKPEEFDELVCSALAELSNITSGNAATDLSTKGIVSDIRPPEITKEAPELNPNSESVLIETDIGAFSVAVSIN